MGKKLNIYPLQQNIINDVLTIKPYFGGGISNKSDFAKTKSITNTGAMTNGVGIQKSVTLAEIERAIAEVQKHFPHTNRRQNPLEMSYRPERFMVDSTFNGMKIHITRDMPKMQLSARVCEVLAPDFIAETNTWMLSFFGTINLCMDGEYIVSHATNCVYMNERTFQQFKRLTDELNVR